MEGRVAASARSETVIDVSLGPRSYPVVIGEGLVGAAGKWIATRLPGARCAVVTDENVAALHLDPLKASLGEHGLYLGEAVVRPGEEARRPGATVTPTAARAAPRTVGIPVSRPRRC